jgi:hypothetical protein
MKPSVVKIIAVVVLLSLVSVMIADDKVSLRTNLFTDNTGTAVQSPALEIVKSLSRNIRLALRYSLDRVVVPPIRGLSATPSPIDAVAGASRPISVDDPANKSFTKERNEITAGLELSGVGVSYYHSKESDYVGRMATIDANFDFNQKNTNLALSYSYGWDRIEPLGTDTLHQKTTHSANLTFTQALTPQLIGRIGVDVSQVSGFQSNPYRAVFAGGVHRIEIHPLSRIRGAGFVKLNRYFTNLSSLNVGYRFYRDDWQVQSHTLDVFYHQYFSDNVLIRYRYRYYSQTGAFFYRGLYPTVEPFMTADYKLEPFNSHLFGFKIEYQLKDLVKGGFLSFLSRATFEAKYERYFSSNDFTADIFQFGLVFNY